MTPPPPAPAACPFCGATLEGRPNQCPRCGTLVGEAANDLKRLGEQARKRELNRKTIADLLFLVGLLAGGPLLTAGGRVRLGLFLGLAGGLTSASHRWLRTSLTATILIGGLTAAVVAVAVTDPPAPPGAAGADLVEASETSRGAYVSALAEDLEKDGGFVEARGPALVTAWFYLPSSELSECGAYPEPGVKEHLRELGFRRIVVADRSQSQGVCSFPP